MLNNKGQAFSVFELMIAGVVAFAILIILLSVISGVIWNPTGNPKDSISTTLKTIGTTGSTQTEKFQMKPGSSISASDFYDKTTLDASSIMFFKGALAKTYDGDTPLKVDISPAGISFVSWKGSQALTAKAQVVCGATAESASDKLQITLDSDKYEYDVDALVTYCGTSQPCCAVVLDKP